MTFKTKFVGREALASSHTPFGIKDEKGREVGCATTIVIETYEDVTDQHPAYWQCMEPGVWFAADYHATRNGEIYGSSNRKAYLRSRAEAEAYLAVQVEKCRKRYAKKYGV